MNTPPELQNLRAEIEEVQKCRYDFLTLALMLWPWGVKGSPLEHEQLDDWQVKTLDVISRQLLKQAKLPQDERKAVRVAIRSGHGPGKSALIAMLLHCWMATRYPTSVVGTANTATQLSTKTWREVQKWHGMCRLKHWFDVSATRMRLTYRPNDCVADAIPWSKERPEAVAGTHSPHTLILYDEASGIPKEIYDVHEGAGLTGEKLWLTMGNQTQNVGPFADSFARDAKRWNRLTVDSRAARKTNKAEIAQWVELWGEDSDFVRVRVRGLPPKAASTQLIPLDLIQEARKRKPDQKPYEHMAKIIGVDAARFGDDDSVIIVRQGNCILNYVRIKDADGPSLADKVIEMIEHHKPDATFIDVVGIGASCYDSVRYRNYECIPANMGESAYNIRHFNRKTDCFVAVRDYLKDGGALPDDDVMEYELASIQYTFSKSREQQMQIVPKEIMKALGLPSPDGADALALTFFAKVERKPEHTREFWKQYNEMQPVSQDYDIINYGLN